MTQDDNIKKSPDTTTQKDLQNDSALPPAPINRRDLIASIPEVALGLGLAAGEKKALAFNNMMIFLGGVNQPNVESYGLWAFGNNTSGQLGVGDLSDRTRPTRIGNLSNWTGQTAGIYHSLARKSDGTLWACGLNDNGQLGLGDAISRSSPVQLGNLSLWSEVASGHKHSLATRIDGTLWAFGLNSYGQLGLSDTYFAKSWEWTILKKYP